ncbi:MAG: PepSY-associated TM helix domain-containing protein [Methylobacter sp.]|nr:PepSY-associated TM helix domain-containing protein [Methylobacter sp.]MDP2427358.1 PepSY-associated TM helix domain-containing protein [Methylobacter sp.]MDP3055392.1 PepSY-associated TM helix domain-containing protein [Methylobacter sp.]MDP3362279.1 PepSY-associated TM helix domain-containing protein [Methylobacter sp.]MDZ4217505.1 PepSY-associated TM helix domain-containing protein [Methylobacter sp.]
MDLTLKSRRKLWLKVHLYLGLVVGAVFVLVGLTGSLLAFEFPLDERLNSKLMTVSGNKEKSYLPLDVLVASGLSALPANGNALSLAFPRHSGLAFELWFEQPSPNSDHSESHQIFINPYTGEVSGQRLKVDFARGWRGPLMDVVLRLHYSLAIGPTGMTIMGLIGLVLVFLLLTGLILWWPSPGKLKKALTIKSNASAERFNFDLHKTFGFYSSVVLLFLALSGVYMIFPEYGRGLVGVFSPVTEPYPICQSVVPKGDKKRISLAEVTAIADARFPGGDYRWIGYPANERGVYVVGKREVDEVNRKSPYRRLWIDQYSGAIIHERTGNSRSAGDIFVEWLYPLHSGEAFGFTGQLIILISGLIPLVLYVTGVIRWLHKQGATRKNKLKRKGAENTKNQLISSIRDY